MLAVALPSPAVSKETLSPPEPIGNPGQWVLPEDYPVDALLNRQTGITAFKLDVNTKGTPDNCEIVQSSEVLSLDMKACELIMKRARFKPARNPQGKEIPSEYRNRVRWVLPGSYAVDGGGLPRMVIEAIVNRDGLIESCAVRQRDLIFDGMPDPCNAMLWQRAMPTDAGRPKLVVRMIQTLEFEVVR